MPLSCWCRVDGEGNAYVELGAVEWNDPALTVQLLRPFFQIVETSSTSHGVGAEAATIVVNTEGKVGFGKADRDRYLICSGMFGNIVHAFSRHAYDRHAGQESRTFFRMNAHHVHIHRKLIGIQYGG